jgi:hypothetical protein
MYDKPNNTTYISFSLTFGNAGPADIIEQALAGGQQVGSVEIYVVQVVVTGGALTPGTPVDVAGPQTFGNSPPMKVVNSGAPGVGWKTYVTLNAPYGNASAINMIHVGFIQNATWTSYYGYYGTYGGIAQYLVSPLVGQSAIDIAAEGVAPQPPWYAATIGWGGNQPTNFSTGAVVNPATIGSFDTPAVALPWVYQQVDPDGPNWAGYSYLQAVNYTAAFTLDVAAQTTDTTNGANLSFWGQARANWSFNANGDVLGPAANAGPITWYGNGAGVTATGFTANASGALMPESYGGQTANTLFNQLAFKQSNNP